MRRALAGGLVAALALVAACSSDDESPAPAAPSTTTVTTTAGPTTTVAGGVTTNAPATTSASTAAPSTPASTGAPDLGTARVTLTPVAEAQEPVFLTTRPGEAGTIYVVERRGRVRALRDGVLAEQPILDVSALVTAGGERGLLGATFSPDGGHLYVNYTDRDGHTNVDEYAIGPDGTADVATYRRLLYQEQPFANHNGGEVIFGPDGYLYIGLGDGGSGGDPERNALNLGTWLGKILRIDPTPEGDQPYTVPPDNPFVGQAGARPEIWSYGLRNPWRFSFDRATGDLWIGDVGQGAVEEVDRSTAAEGAGRGTNFGWSAFEGRARYNDDQPVDGAVPPAFQFSHADGNCSVTGGYVYRGAAIPALQGAYVYTDYCTGGVRAIVVDAAGTAGEAVLLSEEPASVSSFGEDGQGELYVCSLGGNTVYRIDPA